MPDMSDCIAKLKAAIVAYDRNLAREMAAQALKEGQDPGKILDVTTEVIREVGDKFATGELFLPELVGAASAMSEAIKIMEAEIEKTGQKVDKIGTVVIGTVKGDVHDIGKTMVKTFLVADNFRVIDLGVDVAPEKFLAAIEKHNPEILALSALLTTTAAEQRRTIETLAEKRRRDKVKVIIGGAAVSRKYAEEIGADGYEGAAPRAPGLCKKLIGKE